MKHKIKTIIIIILFFTSIANTSTNEKVISNKDKSIIVYYKIADGYKISIRIDTNKKKNAYSLNVDTDANLIRCDFIDVNNVFLLTG